MHVQTNSINQTLYLAGFIHNSLYFVLGGRRPGHGQAVRQRLLADHHLPLRGLEPLLQEHVQAQTPAGAMAQRRRQQPP